MRLVCLCVDQKGCVSSDCAFFILSYHWFRSVDPYTKFNSTSVVNPSVKVFGINIQCVFVEDFGLKIIKTDDYILCGVQVFQVKSVNFIIDFVRCGEFSDIDIMFCCFFMSELKLTPLLPES